MFDQCIHSTNHVLSCFSGVDKLINSRNSGARLQTAVWAFVSKVGNCLRYQSQNKQSKRWSLTYFCCLEQSTVVQYDRHFVWAFTVQKWIRDQCLQLDHTKKIGIKSEIQRHRSKPETDLWSIIWTIYLGVIIIRTNWWTIERNG